MRLNLDPDSTKVEPDQVVNVTATITRGTENTEVGRQVLQVTAAPMAGTMRKIISVTVGDEELEALLRLDVVEPGQFEVPTADQFALRDLPPGV